MELVDVTLPDLKKDEVRFRVIAAPVNRADIEVRSGNWPIVRANPFPYIPGIEAVGQITECGKGVHGIKVGEHVVTMMQKLGALDGEVAGAYQEFVTVNVYAVMKLLDGVEPIDAVALGLSSVTAWNGISRLKLHKNETVLITGASGGVGSAAVQIAKALGFKVAAITTQEAKADYLRSIGADRVINIAQQPLLEQIAPRSMDGVLDTVGQKTFSECVSTVKKGGRLCCVGAASGGVLSFMAADLLQEIILTGWSSEELTGDKLRADLGHLIEWHQQGRIKTPAYKCMPLAEAAKAHELMEANGLMGRILLTPGTVG